MPGCTIRCSNIYGDENGKAIVAPLEYETVGLIGSNLGINNLDTVARINYLINDLGLDTIEIGAALGVAAEAGLMKFGDSEMVIELINEIKNNTSLGRIIGSGAVTTGRIFGIEKVPAVKGQAMSAYDPRAIKGTGVTYATSPQGADHTAGLTIRAKVDHLDPSIQTDLSRKAQINMAGYDSLGACIFAGFGFAAAPETVKELINAKYNWGVRDNFLQELGKVTLKLELEFNKNAGFTANDDRIPEWMRRVSLPPFNGVFDVPDKDLDEMFNW
jgi:aldehyde:ferredoxin oxidoreductase